MSGTLPPSLSEGVRLLRDGDLSPLDWTRLCLERIEAMDGKLNCFLAVDSAGALAGAEASAKRHANRRPLGALDGVPIALKDLIDSAGWPTTAGLRNPWRAKAERDAFLAARLRAAGAVFLGKLNLHEAAMGATTDNPHYGKTGNPWNPGHTPGGSSGGSGAAVAAGLCAAALGSDTMGSVRIPAAYCGVSGLKPTFGRFSLSGVTPLCWSMDTVGPLAREAGDLALMAAAMDGFDPEHPLARAAPGEAGGRVREPFAPERAVLGVMEGWGAEETEPEVLAAFETALSVLADAGCSIRRFPGADLGLARRHGLVIIEGDAARIYSARMEADPGQFGEDVRAQLNFGAGMEAGRLARAHEYRGRLRARFERVLSDVDAVISPAVPQAAFPFGGEIPSNQACFTAPANLCGLPSVSLPMGFNGAGLPLGLQLTGREWEDARVLALGTFFQTLTDWHRRRPSGESAPDSTPDAEPLPDQA